MTDIPLQPGTKPWQGNTFKETQGEVHITKIKCEVPADSEGTGIQRRIRAWFVLDKGRSKGAEFDALVPLQEAAQAFKFWCNVETMQTGQEFVFDVDECPFAFVVWRNRKWQLSNIQTNFTVRAKVIEDMMVEAGLANEYNTAENRETIRQFDTTAQAKQWAAKYIEEKKEVTDQAAEPKADDLTEALGRSIITATDKSRKEFFSRANAIFKRYEFDDAEWDWRNKEAIGVGADGSRDDYTGDSIDAAVRSVILYCMDKKPDHEAVTQDFKALMISNDSQLSHFKAATGFANRADAYQNGKTASELYIMVENWLKNRKQGKSNEKATNLNDSDILPPTTTVTNQPLQNERSSVAGNGNQITSPKSGITTITGIDILDIASRLNVPLPPEAYGAIKHGQMSGNTDLDGDYVRNRLDEVFGSSCWRVSPNPTCGRVEFSTEDRSNSKGEIKTWYICKLVAHTFQYAVKMPDGIIQWIDGSTTSDQHDNMDEQYAQRGAMTSLMKQFYRLMGGMDHIIRDEYTHVHAQRDIAKRNQRKAG